MYKIRKWEDILTIISGKNQKGIEIVEGKYPIYGSGGIIGRADSFLCPENTVIIGRKGTINRPIYVAEPLWNIDTAFGLVAGEELLPKFLYYFCILFNFKSLDKSTGRPSVSKSDLLKIEMPVPSIKEQHCIVSRIEELFSELDKGVETLQTIKQQLAVYRQAVLTSLYPKMTSENMVTLDSIAEITSGITKGRKLDGNEIIELPYLRVANVQNGYLDLNEIKSIQLKSAELEKYLLQYGDVLYTEGGDRDKLGRGTIWQNEIEKCVHQNHVFKARIDKNRAISKYVAYWSMSTPARNYFYAKGKQSVNLASINKTILSALPLPLPSLIIQQKIVTEIEEHFSVCDSIEQTVDSALAQAESMRQSILKKAFEGGFSE